MKTLLLLLAAFFVCHVQGAFKFVCQKCAKDNIIEGFDDEEDFVKHSEWHVQQNIDAQNQLKEEARIQQAADDLRPKLFHCHHCQFVTSFNSSAEFIAHIEKEHQHTTIEENTVFVPQGKLKMKGYKAVPPELENLNAQFAGAAAGGGWGGGGGYGGGPNGGGYGGFDGVMPGAGWADGGGDDGGVIGAER